MKLKKLVKAFEFLEDNRRQVTLGPSVRLNPQGHRLELVSGVTGFPLTADLYAKTRLTTPTTAKRWIGFEAVDKQKKRANVVVTSIAFRLSSDGSNQLWWNGAAWVAAAPGQWNTELEVAENIAAFNSQSVQVVINLKTTAPDQTPEVYAVKLLYESDIEFEAEYIARSLIPALREELRPIAEFAVDAAAPISTVDLKRIETPYKFAGVDSVYNLTSDPDRRAPLAHSYNATTKVVTLTAPATGRVLVRFTFEPQVMILRSQDYEELSKVPAVCIESIVQDSHLPVEEPGPSVCNRFGDGAGWQLKDGYQADIDFTVKFVADKTRDLDTLGDALKTFFANRLLRARGQDEFLRVQALEEYSHQTSALQSELHSARLRARIFNAVFYVRDAVAVTATQRFDVAGGNVEFQV
jgi:hypothetical protein